MRRALVGLFSATLLASACGESVAPASLPAAETAPGTTLTDVAQTVIGPPAAGFALVANVEELIGAIWVPTEADGQPVNPAEADFWRFITRNDTGAIEGNDGCNGFSADPLPVGSPLLIDGVVQDVETGFETGGCGVFEAGPYPQTGDTLWVDDERSQLIVTTPTGDVRVRLEPRADKPELGELPPDTVSPSDLALEEAELEKERAQFDEAAEQHRIDAAAANEVLRSQLPAARALWEAAGLDHYELQFDVVCLACNTFDRDRIDHFQRQSVIVANGVAAGPWADDETGGTVTGWFDYLDATLAGPQLVVVDFDAVDGHPTRIYLEQEQDWVVENGPDELDDFIFRDVQLIPRNADDPLPIPPQAPIVAPDLDAVILELPNAQRRWLAADIQSYELRFRAISTPTSGTRPGSACRRGPGSTKRMTLRTATSSSPRSPSRR